jgi:hypothetical protein
MSLLLATDSFSRGEFTPLKEASSRKKYAHTWAKFIAMVIRVAELEDLAKEGLSNSEDPSNSGFWSAVQQTQSPTNGTNSRDVADAFQDIKQVDTEDVELLATERQQLQDEGLDSEDEDYTDGKPEPDSDTESEADSEPDAEMRSDTESDGEHNVETPRYPVSLTTDQKTNALALKNELLRADASQEDIDNRLQTLFVSLFTEELDTYRSRHSTAPVEAFLFIFSILTSESSHTIRSPANTAPYLSHIQYLILLCFTKQMIASANPWEYVHVSSICIRLNITTAN